MVNSKYLLAIAGAALAAVGIYLLIQPIPIEDKKKPEPKRPSPPQKLPKAPPAKIEEIKEEEKKPLSKLSLDQYINYLQLMNKLALEKFTILKKEFIQSRRQQSDNPIEYEKVVRKFKVSESKVMESAYNEMVEKEHLDRGLFNEAREEYMNKHEVAVEREKLKRELVEGQAPDGLDVEKLKEIMQAEIKLLTDANSVDDVVKNIETISRIEDKLYDQFGYEIDQIRGATQKYQAEVKGLSRQIIRNYHRFNL
jgi:hypothetical protein